MTAAFNPALIVVGRIFGDEKDGELRRLPETVQKVVPTSAGNGRFWGNIGVFRHRLRPRGCRSKCRQAKAGKTACNLFCW